LIGWRSPPGGTSKSIFDDTHSSFEPAEGIVIRDWTGRFIQAGIRFLEDSPIVVAEATAMRDGIQAALVAGTTRKTALGYNQNRSPYHFFVTLALGATKKVVACSASPLPERQFLLGHSLCARKWATIFFVAHNALWATKAIRSP